MSDQSAKYFYYEKMPTGNWQGVKSKDKPIAKSANGANPEFRQVVVLMAPYNTFEIAYLEVVFPLKLEKDYGTST